VADVRSALVVVNREGVILLWAGDAEDLTGHTTGEVVGHSLDVIVPPQYRERHWRGFRAAMESGTARVEGAGASIPVLCGDGSIRRFPARFTLVRDARGRAVGAAAAVSESRPDDPPFYEL
jgi:PAS domain S-box-containing protein